MGFYYSGNIEKLKTFYLSMRKINVQIGTFEYTYNGTYYREQTAQNISHKRLNKGMTQGKMYSIYIDPKHPAVFVLTKRIRIGTIVAIILGLFLFTGGIDSLLKFLSMLLGR
jgi:hypothetical protein